MAVINFNRKELSRLVGRELSLKDIEEAVPSLGMPIEKIDGDEVSVDITPDRPDLLCVEGLARAVSTFIGVKQGCPSYSASDSGFKLIVDSSVKKVRPFIAAAVISDINLDEEALLSIIQLQEKLHDTIGRKRKKISIGVYKLDGLVPPFTFKAVPPKKASFIPLDSTENMNLEEIRTKHPKGQLYGFILEGHNRYPLLVDSKETVLSMPPLINSESTRVVPGTRDLFVDITGTSKHTVNDALGIICAALADRGGKVEQVTIVYGSKNGSRGKEEKTPDFSPIKTAVSAKFINGLLGVAFSEAKMREYLERMGHSVEFTGKKLVVTSPFYRSDIIHDVDIAEDVAIAHGYNNFEPSLPKFASIGSKKPLEKKCELVRDVMVGFGFQEVLNWYISNKEKNYAKMLLPEGSCVSIMNPNTVDFTIFRTWCIPSLLEVFANNKHAAMPQKIFEVGDTAEIVGGKVVEKRKLAAAICDPKTSFNEIRSILESTARELGLEIKLNDLASHPSFIPGRAAEIILGGKPVGVFGEIHPHVLNNFGIEHPAAVFELDVD